MASRFQLSSSQTAVALVVPVHLSKDVDSIRSVHDKAFGRWPAHINLLYPSVPLTHIYPAIDELRKHLLEERRGKIKTKIAAIDVFRHTRSATIFLKPSDESAATLCQIRDSLCSALGVKPAEGTPHGEFRPHLTLGQTGIKGAAIDSLVHKAQNLIGLEWESASLVVLKRTASGEMVSVAELPFGDPSEGYARDGVAISMMSKETHIGWKGCFEFQTENWLPFTGSPDVALDSTVLVSSMNLMTADYAPEFRDRLPLIAEKIASLVASKDHGLRVLCLQEANVEFLGMLLASPVIQQHYPYSSHGENSKFQSHRNLVTLASAPFRSFNLQFQERHKSSLIVQFGQTLTVANVHLTSALTDESVETKSQQLKKLAAFLNRSGVFHQAILTGDFNITTSSRTLQTAIERRIVTPETAKAVQALIDPTEWEDAFVAAGSTTDEIQEMDYYPGEEGATFDRIRNPLAALSEAPVDDRPQRYDRIIYRAKGAIETEDFGIFLRTDEDGNEASDHYGIYGVMRVSDSPRQVESAVADDLKKLRLETIAAVKDETDILPLVAPFLPSADDRLKRKLALEKLKEILTADGTENVILAPLGSFSMDTYFPDSDVDILVIGSSPPRSFFEQAVELLRKWKKSESEGETFRVHLINSLVQIIEVEIYEIKFDLQYCHAPELVQR
jgi:2'-5' RNA ligase/endonuclease/exonuclease/phosphatase family metal-dependent hydrolase